MPTAMPTMYLVDAYAYGCAHDAPALLVTTSLERALLVLADELDTYADSLAEIDTDDREELEELERALAYLEELERSAGAWARVASGGYASPGELEALETALERIPGGARVRSRSAVVEGIDEPGSSARGRTFVLEVWDEAPASLEELEELDEETADAIREELEARPSA
jgi:hypothetical protein